MDVGDYTVEGNLEAYSCKSHTTSSEVEGHTHFKREREVRGSSSIPTLTHTTFICSNTTLRLGKLAGVDKKLSRSLDQEVATSVSPAGPSHMLSESPVGPLTEAGR